MQQGKAIRVLHVIGVMNRGGAEAMIMNLYRKIDRSKIQFDFVVHTDEKAAFDEEITVLGGKIYHCPRFRGKNIIKYVKWWDEFFKKEGKDHSIVHGHIGSTAVLYLKVAKKYDKYTIAHSHSSGTDKSLKHMAYMFLSYNTRNIADYFFACSQAAGVDRYGTKIAGNTSVYKVLNNAIDTETFQYDEKKREDMRRSLNLCTQNIVVGHIGRFTAEKNHSFIIDVFSEMLKINPKVRLLLVGDGPMRKMMEEKSESLGLADKVVFMGVRSDVNVLIQGMDVLLFPSIFEGLPVTLVECQTAGLPCVISSAVPAESILVKDLVTVKSLKNGTQEWAEAVLASYKENRKNYSAEIKERGYDITATVKWLEEFYVSKERKRN